MTITHDRARCAKHEAGHVAGLILGGRLPARVTADWPRAGIGGQMVVDWGDGITRQAAAVVAISILMGPIAEGAESWPPGWPLDADADGDQAQLAILLGYLKVGKNDYYGLVREARTLAGTAEFQRLVSLIARALELKDVLDANDLRHLLGEKTLAEYGIPHHPERKAHAS